jgi:hypothetical protein
MRARLLTVKDVDMTIQTQAKNELQRNLMHRMLNAWSLLLEFEEEVSGRALTDEESKIRGEMLALVRDAEADWMLCLSPEMLGQVDARA